MAEVFDETAPGVTFRWALRGLRPKTTERPVAERCPECGTDAAENWFDRSLCATCDAMHTRCIECGAALDGTSVFC